MRTFLYEAVGVRLAEKLEVTAMAKTAVVQTAEMALTGRTIQTYQT